MFLAEPTWSVEHPHHGLPGLAKNHLHLLLSLDSRTSRLKPAIIAAVGLNASEKLAKLSGPILGMADSGAAFVVLGRAFSVDGYSRPVHLSVPDGI
jgi:hypothetical protein